MATTATETPAVSRMARTVLAAFVLTFLAARILVLLIMSRRVPDLFLHLGGTHVHHLNYGIFLLSGVGAWLLFTRPGGRRLKLAAVLYGIGLALTFDEFGMWLHLGGGYWQRASYDAVVVITAVLSLACVAPAVSKLTPRHLMLAMCIAGLLMAFFWLQYRAMAGLGERVQQQLQKLEQSGPP